MLSVDCRSQHTLPVTGLAVGAGEANPRVVTCSMDQTCRVWSTATGACLQTVLLPSPLTCTSLHWTEQGCFLGAADSKIYHIALSTSDRNAADSYSAVTAGAGAEVTAMVGHTQAVTALSLDLDGALLVSGTHLYKVYIVCLYCIFYTVLELHGVRQGPWSEARCHSHTPRLHTEFARWPAFRQPTLRPAA
jgi:WD40 repeat protein